MEKPTVLIVDDNRTLAQSLAELLARRSFRTMVTDRAATALRLALRVRPRVVIADVQLPDVSGLDLAQRLAVRVPGTRVILISAGQRAAAAEKAGSVLATVQKPFDPLRLVSLVRRAAGLPPLTGDLHPHVGARGCVRAPAGVSVCATGGFALIRRERQLPALRAARLGANAVTALVERLPRPFRTGAAGRPAEDDCPRPVNGRGVRQRKEQA